VVIPLADGKRITATISSPVFYDIEGVRQHVE
jgi:sarcosine oxidase subunit alpha